MKRILIGLLTWLLAASPAPAQMMLLGTGAKTASGPAPPCVANCSVWDPAFISGRTVFNGTLNLDFSESSTADLSARSSCPITSGMKVHAEFTLIGGAAGDYVVGIGDTSQGIPTYVGSNTHSIGLLSNGNWLYNNGTTSGGVTYAVGNTIVEEVDYTGANPVIYVWVAGNARPGTGKTTALPATPATGNVYFSASIGSTSDKVRANYGQSAWAQTPTATYVPVTC